MRGIQKINSKLSGVVRGWSWLTTVLWCSEIHWEAAAPPIIFTLFKHTVCHSSQVVQLPVSLPVLLFFCWFLSLWSINCACGSRSVCGLNVLWCLYLWWGVFFSLMYLFFQLFLLLSVLVPGLQNVFYLLPVSALSLTVMKLAPLPSQSSIKMIVPALCKSIF